jgi:hypothetical protein
MSDARARLTTVVLTASSPALDTLLHTCVRNVIAYDEDERVADAWGVVMRNVLAELRRRAAEGDVSASQALCEFNNWWTRTRGWQ